MEGQTFIFALSNKLNNFWQVDASNNVTISSQPYFLKYSPDGWENLQVANIRNKKYWGIDRSVSAPLSYVRDGAQILKHIFYTLGIEESVYLSIGVQELDYTPGVSYGYWYRQIFRGEVDLSTFQHVGPKVTCTTLEDGLPKFLKSNENTVYEFPMNVQDAIIVKMDGIRLHDTLNYTQLSDFDITADLYTTTWFVPTIFTSKDGDNVGFVTNNESVAIATFPLSNVQNDGLTNNILTNGGSVDIDVTITGRIQFVCTSNTGTFRLRLQYVTTSMTLIEYNTLYHIYESPVMVIGTTYTHDYTTTVTIHPGDSLFLIGTYYNAVSGDVGVSFTENSTSTISFITRKETTYIRALTAQYLFSNLVNKFTEGNYTAQLSSYFETYKQKVFTCGNAIRGFDDAVMKISWSTFFKDWDSFDSVGITESDKTIGFDTKEDLLDFTNKIQLQAPADGTFKVSVSNEFRFNEAEYGYPEIKNDIGVQNGNQAFNTKWLWSIGTTKTPSRLDKVSEIGADPYPIELIRVVTIDKVTTDYKSDNDLFSLYIEPTSTSASGDILEHYKLDRSLNSLVTDGLLEAESIFNLALTPKRNLIRNGRFMSSSLYLADNKVLAYQSTDKNNKLVCNGIVEKADVLVADMGGKFFYPLLMEGDFPAPDNLEVLLDLNPMQIFTFPLDGQNIDGILMKVSVAPSKRDVQGYQFLSTAYNPIEKLIEYYG